MKAKSYFVLWILITILALAVGSTMLPAIVGARDLLGQPDVGFVYGPHRIMIWSILFTFDGSQLLLAWGTTAAISLGSGAGLLALFFRGRKTDGDTYGTSKWQSTKELKKLGLTNTGGVVMGQTNDARYKLDQRSGNWKMLKPGSVIYNDDKEHVLVVAPTRRGKGINFVIPTLLKWKGSVVCYDLKKENWDVTSGFRRQFSHAIRFEPTSPTSTRWNPLLEIEPGDREIPGAQNLAEILSNPYGNSDNDHWRINARELLVGVILHVLYAEEDKTLNGMYAFLNDPNRELRATLELMLNTDHKHGAPHPKVAQTARNMLNKADNELSSVVSTASSYLTLYQDPIVARATSVSDWQVSDLMSGASPVSLYLVINPQDADRLTPLTRLALQMIGTKLTAQLGGYKHRLLFLIDEFPTLGNLEFFERQLAFFAGYGIKCALIAQSFGQLRKHYGRDTSIPDNCRFKVILGADSPDDANLITQYLGQQTIDRQTETRSGNIGAFVKSNRSVSESEVGRSLLTSDEVLRLPFNEILLLTGGSYPYKAAKIMYFLDPRFEKFANMVPPETEEAQFAEVASLSRDVSPWLLITPPAPPEPEAAEPPETEIAPRERVFEGGADVGPPEDEEPDPVDETNSGEAPEPLADEGQFTGDIIDI